MPQLTRNNHFLPRWYLRRWSEDGAQVLVFSLLVSRKEVPSWARKGIASVGSKRDLYTGFEDGAEVDRFEAWLTREFEEPAIESVRRAVDGERLRGDDVRRLAMFFAVQDLRTPAALIEFLRRWGSSLPGMIDDALQDSVAKLTAAIQSGMPAEQSPAPSGDFAKPVLVRTVPAADRDGGAYIHAEVLLGRGLWLNSTQDLLTGVANHLATHAWSIVEPYGTAEWFTSDHPALKLNYYKDGPYDFGGGWGNKGTELMLPLSPRHLLYTKVGATAAPRFTMPRFETFQIQRFLAERAHREIIARREERRVSWFRQRVVDAERFADEERQWKQLHEEQRRAEVLEREDGAADIGCRLDRSR